MSTSRDDFVIAIRSAFLKRSTKQNFSLLSLLFISIFIIILASQNFKIVKNLKSIISEIVYRTSFVVSVPENLLLNSYFKISEYSSFYKDYEINKKELENFEAKEILNEIIISENRELKELIEEFTFTRNKILAKVIVDNNSPFSKTIIINKGSRDGLKIGTNIFDENYLIGRVIEINFKTSRVLLLSDLNSNIPISIIPGDVQVIMTGDGINSGKIKYIKDNLIENIQDQGIGYTSGTGNLFRSGVPVGRIVTNKQEIYLDFYSDFSQLKYVLAEIESKDANISINNGDAEENTEVIKIKLLNDQIKILNETNLKFIEENTELASKNKDFFVKNKNLKDTIERQAQKIKQNKSEQKELEFLRLNLLFSSKCQKNIFKKGYKIGTPEYKNCIMKKGRE